MACYHPLKAFPIGVNPSGKTNYKITSYEVDHVEINYSGSVVCCSYPFEPQYRSPLAKRIVTDFVEIPCGKCIGCRLEYSRQWANRMMLELQYHDSAFFVTFTYDDAHVPTSCYEGDFGDVYPSLTLCKRDFQLMMKRLRKACPNDRLRYFMAGEYGEHTMRPHYHAIIFGLHLPDDDLFDARRSKLGFLTYRSRLLEQCWSRNTGEYAPPHNTVNSDINLSPFCYGMVRVGEVTWETCAYVARYVTKKLTGPESNFYSMFCIEPPFTLMSRKPGIGRQYYDDHPDCFDFDYINISTDSGGRKFRPPKYYQKLFEVDEPELSAELKATRKRMAEEQKKLKLSKTDLSYLEMLAVEEQKKLSRIKSLERSKI